MKLTFLGTGTSTGVPYIGCKCAVCNSSDPKDNRLRCSALLETEGKKILLDCGPDFRQQALRAGLTHLDIILLTHKHTDHVGGLDDLRPFGRVPIYANRSTIAHIHEAYSYCFDNDYNGIPQIELHQIRNEKFTTCGIEITPILAYHYKLPNFGYRIGNFAYLTDYKTIEEREIKKLMGLDVLVLDALRYTEHFSHASVGESLALVERVKPKSAYFVHANHDIGLHETVEAALPENVHLAYDGLTIEF